MQKFKKILDPSVKIQLWRRRRLENFYNFPPLGGGAAVFISYQRRRLGNFKNFLRLGGGGCIFLGKIGGGGGGSADRLTPLYTHKYTLLLEKLFFFLEMLNKAKLKVVLYRKNNSTN